MLLPTVTTKQILRIPPQNFKMQKASKFISSMMEMHLFDFDSTLGITPQIHIENETSFQFGIKALHNHLFDFCTTLKQSRENGVGVKRYPQFCLQNLFMSLIGHSKLSRLGKHIPKTLIRKSSSNEKKKLKKMWCWGTNLMMGFWWVTGYQSHSKWSMFFWAGS